MLEYIESKKRAINIKFEKCQKSNRVMVFIHGFLGDISSSGQFDIVSKHLNNIGVSTLRYDMSGCGKSECKRVSFKEWEEDLVAIIEKLKREGYLNINILAYSLGALIFLNTLELIKNIGIHIETAFFINPVTNKIAYSWESRYNKDRLKKLFLLGYMEIGHETQKIELDFSYFKVRENVQNIFLAKQVNFPLYIFHGECDERVPIQDSKLFSQLNSNIHLEVIKNGKHRFMGDVEEIIRKIINILGVANDSKD